MSMLKEAFAAGKFGVTAEMAPPKGYDFSEQLEAAKLLNGKVHGVNVTDMQSASLKASSLGLCVALKNAGVEPILQMTGRDRNRMAIMGDILSAAAFGIDTMLALTGDHPVVGDCPESKPVYDLDSVGILKMLTKMEQTNCDCGGNEIAGGAPKFYKGASVTPVYDPIELQINKLRQKVENGAEYIQTQGIFDLDTFKRFLDKVDAAGIKTHIMAGIIPLKAAGMARYMNENVPGIAAMAAALEDACAHMEENRAKVTALRDKLIAGLSQIPHSALNGDPVNRLPGNVNFCFEGIEGESLLLLLDDAGICASSGSACTSGSPDPSHVLLAIGRPHEVAHGSLRLSLSEWNQPWEIDHILREVPRVVAYLRSMSPVWKDLESGKKQFML